MFALHSKITRPFIGTFPKRSDAISRSSLPEKQKGWGLLGMQVLVLVNMPIYATNSGLVFFAADHNQPRAKPPIRLSAFHLHSRRPRNWKDEGNSEKASQQRGILASPRPGENKGMGTEAFRIWHQISGGVATSLSFNHCLHIYGISSCVYVK